VAKVRLASEDQLSLQLKIGSLCHTEEMPVPIAGKTAIAFGDITGYRNARASELVRQAELFLARKLPRELAKGDATLDGPLPDDQVAISLFR
jgi:hypothetical protein